MKNAITRFRSSLMVITAVAVAACAGDDLTAPETGLTPNFNFSGTGSVRLTKRGPAGTTATFSISATGGSLPLGATVTLNACPETDLFCFPTDVWYATGDGVHQVTITEISHTGNVVFDFIGVTSHLDGSFVVNVPTVTVNADNTGSVLVRFKNIEGPPQLPALRVEKTAGNATVNIGSPVSFAMTVYSDGPGTATGVTLTDPLPGGLGINWSTATAGCSISGSAPNQTLNCSFGDLAAGETRTANVTSNTTFNLTQCGTLPNTVTVNATNHASVQASATINLTGCARGETATGQGFAWAATQGAPNNWFMYTPWVTTGGHAGISSATGANLIAGQHYDAGQITGTRGTTTSITITLHAGWAFFNATSNVKINPMSCTASQPYVSPGQFAVKRTASAAANSITVTGLPNTACYGIHVDVVGVQ